MNELRLVVTIIAFLAFAASAMAQSGRVQPTPTPASDEDTVRIVTEEVKVNVIAFDESGQFVADVQATDLVITENDILHQATSLRRLPANVLIVLDTGGELRSVKTLERTRDVARNLVRALRPEDSIAILQYADTAEIVSEWTTDRGAIAKAIGSTKFGRRSAFTDAIRVATDFLMKNPVDNRHMVLITDGTDSFADRNGIAAAFRSILATDINVHVLSFTRLESIDIDPRTKAISNSPPPRAMPPEVAAQLPNGVRDIAQAPKIGPTIIVDRKHLNTMRQRKADLEASEVDLVALAENTNGTVIVPEMLEELETKPATIARMIDSSYVLTYTPKISLNENSGVRRIEVTSRRPGLVVEARRKLLPAQSISP